ncbi:hypothetical protein HYX17_01800 [Candidatus Woesearchaeota archaeon]|nr:hypothetical protein [Candidatus Woesearchaeota archaeon]
MIDLNKQNELFKIFGEKLKKKTECYVIGGSAMIYYGMKDSTKYIDLVFEKEKDREYIVKLLNDLGYRERKQVFCISKRKTLQSFCKGKI